MLILSPETLRPSDPAEDMSRARNGVFQFTTFEIYRNGVLDHVIRGPEGLVRNRMRVLDNQHPDDTWDYAPARHWHAVAAE